MLTVKMERVAIKYELDRMIVSEGMFHYYHAFPIAKGAKEGWNLMVRLMWKDYNQAVQWKITAEEAN